MSLALAGRNFDRGYQSDTARDQLPPGVAYRLRDYIPQLGAAERKRGGWVNSTVNLGSISACNYVAGLSWVPFSGDPHLLIVSDNGKVFNDKSFDGTGGMFIGPTSFSAVTHSPIWHQSGSFAVILQALGAAGASPWKYFDSGGHVYSLAPLGGLPPQASVGASWGDYMLLANGYVSGTLFPNRIWVSDVGLPESWNPGSAFWDLPAEVLRLVPMQTSILAFGYTDVWSLTGDTPPPGGNWTQKTPFQGVGCMDGRSVTTWQNYAIWANNTGVYKSDGYALGDLTDRGGIKQRWQELVNNFDFKGGWSAAAGIFRDHYVIVVRDGNGAFVTCQVCDLNREIWFEFTNVPSMMFAQRASGPGTATVSGPEELFFAHRLLPYVGKLSGCWSPSSANANDGDGVAVLPEIELPFYKLGGAYMKQIRRARITYDIRSAGGSPYIAVSYVTSPEEGAVYQSLSGVLPTTTKQTRRPVEIRQRALGIGLKLTQVGASADTSVSEIELDVNMLEGMR